MRDGAPPHVGPYTRSTAALVRLRQVHAAAGRLAAGLASRTRTATAAAVPLLAAAWRRLPPGTQWRLLWLANAKFSVGVTGIVFDDEGRVLLLNHTFRRRYPWGLLSGWVKRRESLEAALRREAAEETSLPITVDRLYRIRTDRLHLAIEAVFLCRCDEGTFRPSGEVTDARWCHADDLPPGLHPHHHPLIHAALRDRARLPKA